MYTVDRNLTGFLFIKTSIPLNGSQLDKFYCSFVSPLKLKSEVKVFYVTNKFISQLLSRTRLYMFSCFDWVRLLIIPNCNYIYIRNDARKRTRGRHCSTRPRTATRRSSRSCWRTTPTWIIAIVAASRRSCGPPTRIMCASRACSSGRAPTPTPSARTRSAACRGRAAAATTTWSSSSSAVPLSRSISRTR